MKFKYQGDSVVVNPWNWIKSRVFRQKLSEKLFYSEGYDLKFDSFQEYWVEITRRNTLIDALVSKDTRKRGWRSFGVTEVIQKVAKVELGLSPGVVFTEIAQEYASKLSEKFPGTDYRLFNCHMLVVPTKNRESAMDLVKNVSWSHARVTAFSEGIIVGDNWRGSLE